MIRQLSAIFLLLIFSAQLFAEGRPKVGLALSGGGAKGFAHIGVLKVLEEEGISADIVTGTSMGSIIGALYAMGYSPAELESLVVNENWGKLFDDYPGRRHISMEQKLYDSRYQISLPINGWSIGLPSAILSGQKISGLLERLMWPVATVQDFTELPRAFSCVATNIENGQAVVFTKGSLPEAVRASMAIPSVFSPAKVNGMLLVDGGLVRNLPAEDAKNLGADIIIGIDVGSPLMNKDKISSMIDVLNQSISLKGAEGSQKQKELCNLLISPEVSGIAVMDFARVKEIIQLGEEAACGVRAELKALADSLGKFPSDKKYQVPQFSDTLRIEKITLNGLKRTSTRLVNGQLGIRPKSVVTKRGISNGVSRIYNSQFYERVSYQIQPFEGGHELQLNLQEKNTNLLRLSFHYDSDDKAAALMNLTFRNLGIRGSMIALDARLGSQEQYTFTHIMATGLKPKLGTRLQIIHARANQNIPVSGPIGVTAKVRNTNVNFFVGSIFSSWLLIGVGIVRDYTLLELSAPVEGFNPSSQDYYSTDGIFWIETLNRQIFPSSGVNLNAQWRYSNENLGFRKDFFIKNMVAEGYIPFKNRISLGVGGMMGSLEGEEIPQGMAFYLGGVDDFYGLDRSERVGNNIQRVFTQLQWEPLRNKFIAFRYNVGNVFNKWNTNFEASNYITGFGVNLGMLTVAGPIQVAIHGGSEHSKPLYHFRFGYNF